MGATCQVVAHLPDDLLLPDAWPPPRPDAVELIETHVSWVLRTDREVLKVKKPVALGFLDFRSLASRAAACESEVRYNARLAPGTYLGVVPITEGADGVLAVGGSSGRVVDWAVRMRRLDDAVRADLMLAKGKLGPEHVDVAAEALARFHAAASVPPEVATRWASPEAVERNVRENFEQTRSAAPELIGAREAAEVERWQLEFLRRHGPLLGARIALGRVRDGHGDLRLEHLYFERSGLTVIDCIEFDERYRVADACADIAFLSMDLAAQGRADLAERLLARYARATDDYDLYAFVDFYEGYRAWVRAKVSAILARDVGAAEGVRVHAAASARRHFLLALACTKKQIMTPTLACVGGLIGSGKSTIAEALAAELSCPIVDADRTRKHLLGVPELERLNDPAWQGAYAPDVTRRVYDELRRRARAVLSTGRSVVVDASMHSREHRGAFRELARGCGAGFRFIECRAPLDVCTRRVSRRPVGASDGRAEILGAFAAGFEAVDELEPSEHLVVDTTRPLEGSLAQLRDHVATWPRGLVE